MNELMAHLAHVEVSPEVLRRDPLGQTWLPESMRQRVATDPAAREAVRRFAACELELYDEADAGPDPFFTARVMESLPPAPSAVPPLQRALVLALFHGLGAVAAYATAWIVAPDELLSWVDQAHVWVDQGWVAAGPWTMLAAVLAAGLGFFALARPRAHTPAP